MTMNLDASREAFEEFLTEAQAGIPMEYPNVPDSATLRAAKDSKAMWGRLTIRDGAGFATDIGTNPNRRWPGIVIIDIFGPRDKGTKDLRTRATSIGNAMIGHTFSNILIRTPELLIIDKNKESPDWCHAQLTVPFELNQLT